MWQQITRRGALCAAGSILFARQAIAAMPSQDNSRLLRDLLDRSSAADEAREAFSAKPRATAFVDPLTDGYRAQLLADRRRDKAGLRTIDRAVLPVGDRIAYDVLAYLTDHALAFIESGAFDTARRAPLDPSFGLHLEFGDFLAGPAPFNSAADYELGLQRIEGFTAYMYSVIARLKEGVSASQVQSKIIVTNVLAEVDALLATPIEQSPFYAPIARMPQTIAETDRKRFAAAYHAIIVEKVYPAFQEWQTYLRETYLPLATVSPGRSAMKGGAALYTAELERHTTTKMSAADIHALGLSEVARILGEMESAKRATGYRGSLKSFFEYVRTDPRFYYKTPDEFLERMRTIEARIWLSIPKLFAHRPKAPFKVAPLPSLGAQRGTGYYRPGPPDGKTPGVLYFNMAMLGTRPIPTLETLTLHEGIPGHHFQINLARENMALPPLLRLREGVNFTAFTEGWGLYSESLGRALGMFGDPYQWFGHLDMEMLRAVRLVVDTGIHALGWERQRAIDYMLANTSMALRDVTVEVDRYIAAPGQACAYKIGERRFLALRARAEKTLGAKYNIRDYHDQILGTGALPMQVLEGKIDGWIAAGGGPGGSGFPDA